MKSAFATALVLSLAACAGAAPEVRLPRLFGGEDALALGGDT